MKVKYLHTMIRVRDIDESKRFYCGLLGLEEIRRVDSEAGKFTLIFLAPPGQSEAPIELTYNWGSSEEYSSGRNFGHLAYEVENIYEMCQKLMDAGITINRPPRDGRMAFVKSPDGISIELLNAGGHQPPEEPWASMPNTGSW
jgi:lactoylglutathione lyase